MDAVTQGVFLEVTSLACKLCSRLYPIDTGRDVLAKHLARHERPPCGTRPGYQAHLRAGEATDPACRRANRDYLNEYKATRELLAEHTRKDVA
jgi:hypothetical protein